MNKRTMEQFWRLLLGGFGRRGGDGCPEEDELAVFAAGEPMPPGGRRRLSRHVARCPDCLEQVLVLRRLAGQAEPLFPSRGASWLAAAWRPAATAAAALVLAGLLYLGGVGIYREEEAALVPAVPVAEQPQPEESLQGRSAGPGQEADVLAKKSEPERRAKDKTPPAPSAPPAPADDGAVFAPEPAALEAQAGPSTAERREQKMADEKQQAAESETRQRMDYNNVDFAKAIPAAPPAAPAPATGGAAAAGAQRLALKEEALAKGREEPDPGARLAELCRARREDGPRITWQGRRFALVEDVLLEEGICARLGRWPVRPATPEEKTRLRETAGYDPAWRGVWLLGDGEITGW